MKTFLEEYGVAILVMLVVIMLILVATPVGTAIKGALTTAVDNVSTTTSNYSTKAENALNGFDAAITPTTR